MSVDDRPKRISKEEKLGSKNINLWGKFLKLLKFMSFVFLYSNDIIYLTVSQ